MNATARIAAKNNTPLVFKNHVPVGEMIEALRDIQLLIERGHDGFPEQRFRNFCQQQEWQQTVDSGLSTWNGKLRICFVMVINGWMMKGTVAVELSDEKGIVEARAKLIHDCCQWLIEILG